MLEMGGGLFLKVLGFQISIILPSRPTLITFVEPMSSSMPEPSWMWPCKRMSGLKVLIAFVTALEPSNPENSDLDP